LLFSALPLELFFFLPPPRPGFEPRTSSLSHALCCHPPNGPQHPLCPPAPLDCPDCLGFTSGIEPYSFSALPLLSLISALPLEPLFLHSPLEPFFSALESFPHPNPFCESSHMISVLHWGHAQGTLKVCWHSGAGEKSQLSWVNPGFHCHSSLELLVRGHFPLDF
jgi:hypothetical protein